MHTRRIISISILLMVAFGAISFAEEYDRDVVVGVMRNNVALIGSLSEAIEDGDYMAIGALYYEFAAGMMEILPYEPPVGSEEDWQATMSDFIYTAFKGVGAAGYQDDLVINASLTRLKELNRQGHGDHKPRR